VRAAALVFLALAVPVAAQTGPPPKTIPPKSATDNAATARSIFAEATTLAETIPDLEDEVEAITAIAGIEWRSGEHEQAARDFELVRRIILREAEGEDENITYLLNGMDLERARAGDIEGALQHASSMNVRERNNLYAAVAEHNVEAGDLSTAFSRVSLMEEEEGSPSQMDELISIFYTALSAGKIADALEIANRISDSQFKVRALCRMAGQEATQGHTEEASRILQEALSLAALQPNEQRNSAASGIRDALRAEIAQGQATIGHTAEAFDTIGLIGGADARNTALWGVMQVLADAGDVEAVRKAVAKISDSAQRITPAIEVPFAMANAGDFDGALRIARGTEDSRFREMMLFGIAKIHLDKGNPTAALAILSEIADFANTISDEAAKGSFFIEIGKMQLAAGDRAAAAASLAKTYKVPGNFRITPVIVEAQVQAGDVAGALRTAGPSRPDYYNQYYGEIALAQARSGNYQEALVWVEALKFPYEKAMALAQLASGILAQKKD
jgi:tetratricopeptide (TPR) repeat protein